MGYFCVPKGKTKRDLVECIKWNADLWLQTTTDDYDYLLRIIQHCVEDYKEIADGKSI
jgi:hypothetical protein